MTKQRRSHEKLRAKCKNLTAPDKGTLDDNTHTILLANI